MFIGSTLFCYKDIHNHIWKTPDGQTTSQIDHILIDGWHNYSFYVLSFRDAKIDSGHFLVTSKFHTRKSNCQREPGKKTKKYSTDKLKNAEVWLQCK